MLCDYTNECDLYERNLLNRIAKELMCEGIDNGVLSARRGNCPHYIIKKRSKMIDRNYIKAIHTLEKHGLIIED